MRWIWIDRLLELEQGKRCVAVKNISLAEEMLHDHFPACDGEPPAPVMPHSLIIEGMAQTAGILVGHARHFQEKVILAKIGKAQFHQLALPGQTLRFTAQLDRIDDMGAAAVGTVECFESIKGPDHAQLLAEIELMFSHIDQNLAGLGFPEHNFVFTDQFFDLIKRSGFDVPDATASA